MEGPAPLASFAQDYLSQVFSTKFSSVSANSLGYHRRRVILAAFGLLFLKILVLLGEYHIRFSTASLVSFDLQRRRSIVHLN
jgi:hypothetical protein